MNDDLNGVERAVSFPIKDMNDRRAEVVHSLQKGESVTASDGKTVTPDRVLGPSRSGRKFSYVTDTLYKPSIADEVRGSDLLICEGMFEDAFIDQAREKKHMTAKQAATIARNAGVTPRRGRLAPPIGCGSARAERGLRSPPRGREPRIPPYFPK